MRSAPVQSFGRPRAEEPPPGPVILPPVQLPPVQVPIVLVVDAASLAAASQAITEMVIQAVRGGFDAALADGDAQLDGADPDGGVRCTGAGLDPHAAVQSGQAADL